MTSTITLAHHGYGHSSRDTSQCTERIARAYILNGTLPEEQETACYADEKPYLYGVGKNRVAGVEAGEGRKGDPVEVWREHLRELAFVNPGLGSV